LFFGLAFAELEVGAPIRLAALDDYGAFSSDSEGLGMVAAGEAISALHWGMGGILRRSRASFFIT